MRKLLGRIEETGAGVLLALMTLLIVVQLVLTRVAPEWASPLTNVVLALFVWATMLGVPAATRRGAHLSVRLVRRWVPERWRWALRTVLVVATVAFFAALAVTAVQLCIDQVRWGNRFVGASWPAWLVTASIPTAAVLSCLRAVQAWRSGPDGADQGERRSPAD
ncbi:MAG: TRAP transporter small permease [Planctomycetota bacterium]